MLRIRLKELREVKKISQAKLAKEIGVSQSTVGMWENGKNHPEHNTLLKIADFFDVPVDYLIGNDVEELRNVNTATRIKVYGHVPAGIPLEAVEDIIFLTENFMPLDTHMQQLYLKKE